MSYFRVRNFDEEPRCAERRGLIKKISLESSVAVTRTPLDYSGRWIFEVRVVQWEGHTPWSEWRVFRSWKKEPREESVESAKKAALREFRFFRVCKLCDKLQNSGHMHDRDVCQGCAERVLGVLY